MSERITGHTELIGLMAYPIRHSGSPAMHNAAFAKLGIDYAYLCFEVGADEIEAGVQALRTLKMRGSNISMPNKTIVGQYLDELTPAAQMCGAVNTIINDNGHLTGTITDGTGFMEAARDNGIDPVGKKMTICGCGGAGTAIEIQAALDGVAEISIFNRKDDFWARGVETVKKINEMTDCKAALYDLADLDKLKEEMHSSYLFVNATSVGMPPLQNENFIPDASFFHKDLNFIDVPYEPKCSVMRQMAKDAGCAKTMNGKGMMLFQGSAAFELWTGQPMPIDYMKETLGINYDE
jgi:shikimate dehydrogenase